MRSQSGEPSVDGTPIEAVGVVTTQDGPFLVFQTVVEKILELLPGPAFADQRVLEPSGHERLRTAAILWGGGAPACDAHWVRPLGIQGQGGLDAQVVHPQIAEVVFVGSRRLSFSWPIRTSCASVSKNTPPS